METKKTEKADLEKQRKIFFQIALIIALAIIYTAFEWTTPGSYDSNIAPFSTGEVLDEDIINTFRKKEPEPPKPKIVEIKKIEIVENDVKVEDDIIKDTDFDTDEPIDSIIFVTNEPDTEEVIQYFIVEEKPTFKGGEKALFKWISDNIVYPKVSKSNNSTGKVIISFVIDKSGKVTDYHVEHSSGDQFLDKEALRVFSIMPDWNPGKQQGKPVSVSFIMPIKFALAD
ncbi:MAG: energy transducer TonB [Marinilabiliales bacterium]